MKTKTQKTNSLPYKFFFATNLSNFNPVLQAIGINSNKKMPFDKLDFQFYGKFSLQDHHAQF